MATISNTPRPGYVWDSTDNVWYPIGVGAHQHTNAADTPAVIPYSTYAAAGKNKIINGDFNVWQRGTSFSPPGAGSYTADRWRTSYGTAGPTTYVVSRETFTPGSEPVSGYNSPYFWRSVLTTVGTCTEIVVQQRIEDVTTFANSTITVSFYAKSDTTRTQSVGGNQNFGSGGSAGVGIANQTITTTSSWQRFSLQLSVPSISGKTIGANSYLQISIIQNLTNGNTLDVWGVQVEAGSVATAFQTATGTIQGELAACQRYYYRIQNDSASSYANVGVAYTTGAAIMVVPLKSTMRVAPTAVDFSSLRLFDLVNSATTVTALTLDTGSPNVASIAATASSLTVYRNYFLLGNTTPSYVGFSAEL